MYAIQRQPVPQKQGVGRKPRLITEQLHSISAHLRHNQQSLKRPNCNLTSVLFLRPSSPGSPPIFICKVYEMAKGAKEVSKLFPLSASSALPQLISSLNLDT